LAIEASCVLNDFVRHRTVAFLRHDIEYRLNADELTEWGCHSRITEITPDCRNFRQHFWKLVMMRFAVEEGLRRDDPTVGVSEDTLPYRGLPHLD
jgi:hypothetical protein